MSDTAITELDELDAQKVSGVGSPANGTPWVLLKATDLGPENAPGAESPEADAQEEEMTKAEADEIERLLTKEMGGFCSLDDCEVCKRQWDLFPPGLLEKAKLKAKARRALPTSAFALPGKRAYPIHDENHARAALSMLHNASPSEQSRIKAAVHRRYPDIGAEKAEPLEKSPGVPDESVATPHEASHGGAAQSGLAGPATAGERPMHKDPSFSGGGESGYNIPLEAQANSVHNPPYPGPLDDPGELTVKSWDIEVVDKQNWLSLDDAQDQVVGGPAWEELDATVLDSAIHSLASAWTAVSAIRNRERQEASKGTEDADLRVARDRLNELLGEGTTKAADNGANTSEEESIMTTVTKEELTQFIADASGTAVKEALKAERKAQKAKMKAKMKGKKPNPFAEKNANNNGDISEGTMRGEVHGQHDANDVNAVPDGGHVDGQYVNKQVKKVKKSEESKALKAMSADLEQLRAALERRPRQGGPVLDGQARGGYPAAEGRIEGTATKSEGELKVEALQKQFDEEYGKPGIEASQRAAHLSQVLTLERLKLAHEQGRI